MPFDPGASTTAPTDFGSLTDPQLAATFGLDKATAALPVVLKKAVPLSPAAANDFSVRRGGLAGPGSAPPTLSSPASVIRYDEALGNLATMSGSEIEDLQRRLFAGGFYCVGPETLVLTDDLRWIPAGEVKEGMGLVGFEENPAKVDRLTNHARPRQLTKKRRWQHADVEVIRNLKRPSYRLTFEDGTEVVSSAEHRWLVGYGGTRLWLETEKLQSQAQLKVIKLFDTWQEDRSWEAAYLAAAFDGEGSVSHSGGRVTMAFAQNANEMLDEVVRCMDVLGFRYGEYGPRECQTNRCSHVRMRSRKDVMRFLGMVRPRRLLPKIDLNNFGAIGPAEGVTLVAKEFLGWQDVVAIQTSTGTFVANGLASHNSKSYYGKRTPGVDVGNPNDSGTVTAFRQALNAAVRSQNPLDDVINAAAASRAKSGFPTDLGSGGPRVTVTLTNPADLQSIGHTAANKVFGRQASQQEIRGLTAAYHQQEIAAQTAAQDPAATNTTQAPNATAFAEQFFQQNNPKGVLTQNYADGLHQVLAILGDSSTGKAV